MPASLTQRVYCSRHNNDLADLVSNSRLLKDVQGSNPAVTIGLPYSSGTKRYGRWPMTVDTWPGPMKPSSEVRGIENGPHRGTIVTCSKDAEVRDPSRLALAGSQPSRETWSQSPP